jgi:hypothetical protein
MRSGPSGDEPDDAEGHDARPGVRGGLDVFDSLIVRQPIRPGRTDDLCTRLATWAAARSDGDVRSVLPVDGVNHVSLFVHRREPNRRRPAGGGTASPARDELLWYVEVRDDDAPEWVDPDRTLRESSPLFDGQLAAVVDPGATVHTDGVDGGRLAVHATHPDRQAWYDGRCGTRLLAPVAGDDPPITVALVRLPLQPGWVSRLVTLGVDATARLKRVGPIHRWLRDQTEILADERVYTESFLLDPVGTGDPHRRQFHYYLEVESMARLFDAFESSDDWKVRVGEWLLRRLFIAPETLLEPPVVSTYELLIHAVHPSRP